MINSNRLNVLAVEPYYGGSHQAFLDSIARHSCHDWTVVSAPARHWKWRMRCAPLTLVKSAIAAATDAAPDVIVCSDMLDLPCWLGMLSRAASDQAAQLLAAPVATYFHENQWTYPQSPSTPPDFHYGYTNLLTALASDACWFNSHFHLTSFFDACESFVRRWPDSQSQHDLKAAREKSAVLPPGFEIPVDTKHSTKPNGAPLRLGWVSRWEFDKRPDRFVEILRRLKTRDFDFQLVLLGARTGDEPALNEIRREFREQVLIDEFASDRDSYVDSLRQMDVVVSTADHEFFGIGVCEAIACGAAPVLPNRLSYVELVPHNQRYESLDDAVDLITQMQGQALRDHATKVASESVTQYRLGSVARQIDAAIGGLHHPHAT